MQKEFRGKKSNNITKIPVLPISYKDALPLLRSLKGHVAPEAWRGSLPIPYHLGPGPAQVHLKLEFNWDIVPIYNVIARMPGRELPDQWIIRGNHHDAWVNGATDPISGMVALMEEARVIGELAKTGWQPKRTLIFCAWDAEEQGLLGSIEWVEAHRDELLQKAVAYINSDSNSRGFLSVQGSQTLERFVNQIARDVEDPFKKVSVLQRKRANLAIAGSSEDQKEIRKRDDLRVPAIGSGSDYTPFIQHSGIASLNIGFGDEEEYGQYHSIYDSFDHYIKYMDPGFEYGVALAKTGGRSVLRLANAEVLPFEFTGISESISGYVDDLKELADKMRDETNERNLRIKNKEYELLFDSRKKFVAPSSQDPVPYLNFAPLENAAAKLEQSAKNYKRKYDADISSGNTPGSESSQKLNAILMKTERALTRKEGLPGRPWWQHQIYAPEVYTGYAAVPLPSISEAIDQRKWKLAEEQIVVVSDTLEKFAAEIDRATETLQ